MRKRAKAKSNRREKDSADPVESSLSFLRLLLVLAVQANQAGQKSKLKNDQKWEIWRTCRHLASRPEPSLAAVMASPVLGALPLIEDVLWKTEAALQSKSLNRAQRDEIERLSDQLDFALALIHRNLGFLISWRGRRTNNPDLFCEAFCKAKGDGPLAAQLIRRCREAFPSEIGVEPDNAVDMLAWDTYQRVEALDRLADEFPDQIAWAAKQMHGWPMLRFRHHDNDARFRSLAAQFDLGSDYPLDASASARFRADTPMVRYLDPLVYRVHHIHRVTCRTRYESIESEERALRSLWWEFVEEPPGEDVLSALRSIRKLPSLTKTTAAEWARKCLVPLILATDARDYRSCKEEALRRISKQRDVKSAAIFKSRLLAAIIPTLKAMARPG